MKLSDKAITGYFKTWPVARLATLDKDGSPHLIPLVFVYQGASFWSPVDGKPKRGGELARIRNAIRNPNGCLLLDHYEEDWSSLWWIRVDVRLEVIRLKDQSGAQLDRASRAIQALERKYPQYSTTPVLNQTNTLLAMHTVGIRSWVAKPFRANADD